MDWITFAFCSAMIAGAATDLKDRTIPNVLTVPAMIGGFLLAWLPGGITPLAALAGIGLAFLLGAGLFALGAFGGGDAKMMMVVGAFLGPRDFLFALVPITLIGGALAAITSYRRGMLGATLRSTGGLALSLVTMGRHGNRVTLQTPGSITTPYGLAIASGSLIAWFTL